MTAPHPLIAQLADERTRRGLSRTAAAQRAGISERSLRDWEHGGYPNLAALQDYLDALGLRLIAIPAGPADLDHEPPGDQIPFGQLILGDGEKACSSCSQIRSRRDFTKDRSRKDGLSWRCRFCVAALYRQRRDRTDREQQEVA